MYPQPLVAAVEAAVAALAAAPAAAPAAAVAEATAGEAATAAASHLQADSLQWNAVYFRDLKQEGWKASEAAGVEGI